MEERNYSQIPAIILCGGHGSRMIAETQDVIPKHLLEVNGKAIMDYSLEPFQNNSRIVLAVSKHAQQIIDQYVSRSDRHRYNFSIETEPKGVVEAIMQAVDDQGLTDGAVAVSRGDEVVLELDLQKMYDFHKSGKFLATLVVTSKPHEVDFIFDFDEAFTATQFVRPTETAQTHETPYCGTGVFILEQASIDIMGESRNWEDFLSRMIALKSLGCYVTNHAFFNINKPEEFSAFELFIKEMYVESY